MKLYYVVYAFFASVLFSAQSLAALSITNHQNQPVWITVALFRENGKFDIVSQKKLSPDETDEIAKRHCANLYKTPLYVNVSPTKPLGLGMNSLSGTTYVFFLDPSMNSPLPGTKSIPLYDNHNAIYIIDDTIVIRRTGNEDDLIITSDNLIDNASKPQNLSQEQSVNSAYEDLIRNKVERDKDTKSDFEKLKIKLAALTLSKEVQDETDRQLKRLERTPREAQDYSMIQSYLEWIASLPWNKKTVDSNDLAYAQIVLDADHFGMQKAKDKILDFLGAKIYRDSFNTQQSAKDKIKGRSPIICLVGPPGVGKTSLGKSVAACLGRKFHKISVGGVDDVSELMGHRKTYIESMPGRIIHALRKAESNNPVLMIDEIDKMGVGRGGSPAAAMLEILDPEQNASFTDHYLGVPFDLSDVLFITTANSLETIPHPLLDRMEIIDLNGYTLDEKLEITNRYLVPRIVKENGMGESGFSLSNEVITELISKYAREAGVRKLEEYIRTLAKKHARALVEMKSGLIFTQENLPTYLGARIFSGIDAKLKKNRVGGANGLAWTSIGGNVLEIQATLVKGSGKVVQTGNLGETMKESIQAATTYIRSIADELKIDPKMFTDYDIHLHFPQGGQPKDGPSAGAAICVAITSLLTNRPYNGMIALTGEVDIHGHVLPIGGVRSKVLAAKQLGLETVLLPFENKEEYFESEAELKGINITWVSDIKEVLDLTLLPTIS